MKLCRCCGRSLPEKAFPRRTASPDGLSYKCRECISAYNKDHYGKSPEARAAVKARARRWAQTNPARRRRISDDSQKRCRAQRAEYARRWRASNPDRARLLGRLAAHRRKISGSLTASEWRTLECLAQSKCAYCGRNAVLTLDHIDPVCAGGETTWDNSIPCCKSCNSSKNKSDIAEWCFRKHGAEGLARALIFLLAKKSVSRHQRKRKKLLRALYGIEIREVE